MSEEDLDGRAWYPRPEEIAPYVESGLIRREAGLSGQDVLAIYSYTDDCQHRRAWNPVTRRCRGLVLEERTGRLVARPFDKFFDLGEMPESSLDALPWEQDAAVSEKLDGVLGILYFHAGSWQITAYWAFESHVGDYAREHLLPRLALDRLDPGYTYLFEIIIKDRRIGVLTYDYDGLVLIGRRHLRTGRLEWPPDLPGIARQIGARELPLLRPPLPLRDFLVSVKEEWQGREGVVVRFANGLMVKVVNREYDRQFIEIHGES